VLLGWVYPVGAEGIVHYDGQRWRLVVDTGGWSVLGVVGTSRESVYAIGARSFFFYNGCWWAEEAMDWSPDLPWSLRAVPGGSILALSMDGVYRMEIGER